MGKALQLESDVIVVGSGPGGATVAKYLAEAGKQVLILERGLDYRNKWYYGTYPGALIYSERRSFLYTREGLNIIAPNMVGGATGMFAGCAARPPAWLKKKYGLDIDSEVSDTINQLNIHPLPEHLRGTASTRIAEAAGTLGFSWYPQPKFMHPQKSKNGESGFNCGATCMLGCSCGAKWHAATWVDDAVQAGARLEVDAQISNVITEGKTIAGVQGKLHGQPFSATAEVVVLSAGGLGTPRILRKSGFEGAGRGMTMDTTVMIYGFTPNKGNGTEPPMTWSWENDDAGYMLSTLTDPWLLYPLVAIRKGILPALRWVKWHKMLGVMIKLKDDITGEILPNGVISKPLSVQDQKKLGQAEDICRKILVEAGAKSRSIFMTPQRGVHPSSTVRVGEMLDNNLQTEIKNLYVCDASVFPESLDRPTVLTIIGLGKRLVGHLLQKSDTSLP